jgi:hypothetical protein
VPTIALACFFCHRTFFRLPAAAAAPGKLDSSKAGGAGAVAASGAGSEAGGGGAGGGGAGGGGGDSGEGAIGDGAIGPMTKRLQDAFFAVCDGSSGTHAEWRLPIYGTAATVKAAE